MCKQIFNFLQSFGMIIKNNMPFYKQSVSIEIETVSKKINERRNSISQRTDTADKKRT